MNYIVEARGLSSDMLVTYRYWKAMSSRRENIPSRLLVVEQLTEM